MSTLLQDVRFALRTLRKGWLVTGLAVVSLALAIGGNAAVFSMVDAFLFRPLPYPEPDRVVLVGERQKDQPEFSGNLVTSLPTYADFAERSRWVDDWGAIQPATLSLRGTDQAEPVSSVRVLGRALEVLGVSAARGRLFTPTELVEGGPRVVVLGHDFWIDRYGPGVEALGEVLTLNGEPHEIIGVLPEGFAFLTANQDLWVPLARSPASGSRDQRGVIAFGRLAADADMDRARAEITRIASDLEAEHPESQRDWTADTYNLRHDIPTRQTRMLFGMLQGSVLLVLLIACVNITNLLLARGQERAREIALRTALGAGRWRIVRQLLTESSLMMLVGAVGGIALGSLGIRLMAAQFVGFLPASFAFRLDERVLLFTLGISVAAGFLFGAVPALQTFRRGQSQTLKEGGARGSRGGRKTFSRALVIGEIALSFVALGGGSLLVRSFLELQGADPGFDPAPLLTANLNVPRAKYPEAEDRVRLNDQVLERAHTLPGVEYAALVSALPQAPIASTDTFRVFGGSAEDGAQAPRAVVIQASPEYPSVMGVELLQGRFFEDGDRADASLVTVVSRSLAQARFGDSGAIGARITVRGEVREVVGVVDDIQQVLIQTGPGSSGEAVYLPAAQESAGVRFLVVRARANPRDVGEPLRGAVQSLDPDLALAQVLTMEEYIAQFFVGVQIFNAVLGGFGLLALLLASLGTYGVLAYSVSRRSHEIGIRMALGAQGRQVVRMFAKQGLWLGVIGLSIGVLLTLPLVGVLGSLLQGLTTVEPSTLVVIAAVLFSVTLVASFVPAGRAAGVDPIRTLRQE